MNCRILYPRLKNIIASIHLFCCLVRLPTSLSQTPHIIPAQWGSPAMLFHLCPSLLLKEPPPPTPRLIVTDGHPSSETISASLSCRKKQQNEEILTRSSQVVPASKKSHIVTGVILIVFQISLCAFSLPHRERRAAWGKRRPNIREGNEGRVALLVDLPPLLDQDLHE